MRRIATFVFAMAFTVGAALGLWHRTAAVAASAQSALNTISYVGTLDSSFTQSGGVQTAHLEWDLEGSQPVNSNVMTWSFTKLTGSYTNTSSQGCSATFHAADNPNRTYSPGVSPNGSGWDVRVYNPGGSNASGDPAGWQVATDGGCNNLQAYQLIASARPGATESACHNALDPDYLVLGNGPSTTDLGCPQTTIVSGPTSVSIKVTASLSFYGRGPGTGPSPVPNPGKSPAKSAPSASSTPSSPTRAQEKIIALDDLVKTLPRDLAQCFDTARAELSTVVVGPLSAQAQAMLGPGFAAGCATDNARLVHDWYVINDPPDPNFAKVAVPTKAKAITLPSCAATAALCRSLKPRVMALVLTARTATAVAAAIETTVNRLAGAEAAQSSSGIARQTAALAELNQRLNAAEEARAKAGLVLSDTLKAAGITVSLTEKQQATSVAYVLARLKKDGVDTDALAAKPGVSFKTGGVDVLALL